MKAITFIAVGLALLGSTATASAQEARSGVRPGYIGIRYDEQGHFAVGGSGKWELVIKDVSKGSPAEKAGLKTGDEILRVNGMSALNGKFQALARTLAEGDTVTLRIKRDGKEHNYTVVAGRRPAGYASVSGDRTMIFSADSVRRLMGIYLDSARVHLDSMKLPRVYVHGDSGNFNIRIERFGRFPGDTLAFGKDSVVLRHYREGVPSDEILRRYQGEFGPGEVFRSIELGTRSIAGAEFTDLDPAMKTYFGTDRGLLTLRVAPETPAARAGLIAGDIVVKANNQAITRVAELRRLLFAQPETLKLEVLRKGETKTLEVQTRRKGSEE